MISSLIECCAERVAASVEGSGVFCFSDQNLDSVSSWISMRARQKTKWGGVSEGWRSQESLQEALHSSTGAQILHRLPIGWVAGARDWKAMAPLKSGFCQARQ